VNEEIYIPGHSPRVTQFMAGRHADQYAQFFLPYLSPGMSLLDCGCGPGSMSADLARIVAPGIVTGVDYAESQIEFARNAPDYPQNLKFEVGSIYSLSFAAGEFDAAVSHALFEHLSEPVKALHEIRRVLKPNSVAGICAPDWSGFIVAPSSPVLQAAISYYWNTVQNRNGGDGCVGGKLGGYMLQAGFRDVKMSARYECYDDLIRIGEYLAKRIEESAELDRAVERGWATQDDLKRMASALREWQQRRDGMFAQAWVSAVGYA
jgi:ubiquinone/menaquinone biosynthesis C-methylase UbiE